MAATTPDSSSLTLSSTTFAKLSPHPYLLANLASSDPSTPSSRTNGRQARQARPPHINTSSLSHAHGSAVVRTGDTTVICGVRGETILTADIPNYRAPAADEEDSAALKDYDLLVPNIELATGCAPNFLPGVPPTTLAQTLSTRVYSLLHSSKLLHVNDFRILWNHSEAAGDNDEMEDDNEENEDAETTAAEVKAYWVLYIDLLFISFDGNPFDAAWAAVLAALKDTQLPKAHWNADREMILCDRKTSPLNLRGLPIACSAAIFNAKEKQKGGGQFWVLVDPDRLEEKLCDETITAIVDRSSGTTKMLGISKSGGVITSPALINKFVEIAEARWQEFKDALK